MSGEQVGESMARADRWSKVIALLAALGLFVLAALLTDDTQFSMIVAAFAGVGVRIYIPYHASVTVAGLDKPVREYESTANYHQGAAGAAVVLASAFAVLVMVLDPDPWTAYAAGVAAGLVSFVALRAVL